MALADTTVVPPHRFGALLHSSRVQRGMDLDEMAATSRGMFTTTELAVAEGGGVTLGDGAMRDLADVYGLEQGPRVAERSRLIVDLGGRSLSVADQSVGLAGPGSDDVLERYLALLYILRRVDPGTRLALREPDLVVLSETLTEDIERLERRLFELMGSDQVDGRARSLLQRFLVPGAGLLVASISVGSLVLVGGSRASASASAVAAEPTPIVQVGTAGAVTLVAPSAATEASTPELARIGAAAEDLISYDWRSVLPGWTIEYQPDSDDYKGLTRVSSRTITIYVDQGASPHQVAEVLAHEIAHAIDVTHLDDESRLLWLEARDMPRVWWAGDGLNDFSVGAGDFAEAVSAVWVGSESDSEYGPFTAAQLELAARLLPPPG